MDVFAGYGMLFRPFQCFSKLQYLLSLPHHYAHKGWGVKVMLQEWDIRRTSLQHQASLRKDLHSLLSPDDRWWTIYFYYKCSSLWCINSLIHLSYKIHTEVTKWKWSMKKITFRTLIPAWVSPRACLFLSSVTVEMGLRPAFSDRIAGITSRDSAKALWRSDRCYYVNVLFLLQVPTLKTSQV